MEEGKVDPTYDHVLQAVLDRSLAVAASVRCDGPVP